MISKTIQTVTVNFLTIILCIVLSFAGFTSCQKNSAEELGIGSEDSSDLQSCTLNVMDYGADNTGVEDSTPAFEALLSDFGSRNNVDIYVPSGRYRITKRIVLEHSSLSGQQISHGVVFRGAGIDVTEIYCDNPEGGFFFNIPTNLVTVTVENMSFVAPTDGVKTAIEFNTADQRPGDHHSRMFQVKDVLIRGEKPKVGYFKNGVLCYNAWYPYLHNVEITGRYGSGSDGYKMETAICFQDCYSPLVSECYVWGEAEYGLLCRGDKYLPEGGVVSKAQFVEMDHGIFVEYAPEGKGTEPKFTITDCHVNYQVNGILLAGVRQVFITNNLIFCGERSGSEYLKDDSAPCDYEPTDLNVYRSNDVTVANNQFNGPGSPKRIGVDISEKSGNVMLNNNLFNFESTAIRNRSARKSYAMGNVFGGYPDFTVGQLVPYEDRTGTMVMIDYE